MDFFPSVTVTVPDWNAIDLNSLSDSLSESGQPVPVRAFNGETLLTLLVLLTPATTPVLVAWVRGMAERSKAYKITMGGVTLQGYTPKELGRVVEVLERGTGFTSNRNIDAGGDEVEDSPEHE